jgi:hypothetical protein
VLNPAERVLFHADGERWEQPAATLECTEGALLDTFLVLVTDVAQRASAAQSLSWPAISGWVEEWQVLLAHRIPMDMERQLGLWGELWVIAQSNDPDTLIAAWRGPENSATDFFVGGVALEVKTSRGSHTHFVSQKQLDSPAGAATAYVLSLWVDIDPAEGRSLADLVDGLLSRVSEPAAFLKQVAQLGYVPADCAQYMSRLALLDVPLWFPLDAVPRVRAADPGVSQLRYKITLDADKAVSADVADSLWTHFGHHQKALL